MKKKLIVIFSFLIFIVLLGLLSDLAVIKIENLLERRIISVLPRGSYLGSVKLKGVTGVSADSIYIKDLGYLPKVEVFYSPMGLLSRRIKKISFDSPSFSISERKEGGEKSSISALFYIEEIEVLDGSVGWKGHDFQINGSGEIFSTGKGEIVLGLPRIWGKIDDIPFDVQDINLSVSDRISSMNVKELRIGNSEFEIRSDTFGKIEGNGKIYLSDLERMFGIKGEGFLDVFFTYDTTITFEGRSQIADLRGFNLPQFDFAGIKDSVQIEGENFSGFFNFMGGIYGQIKLTDFDIKKINSKYPSSKLSGLIDFNYMGKDTFCVISKLKGEVLKSPLENLNLGMTKKGKNIYVDSCKGYFNGGNFVFSGVYTDKIDGNLQIDKLDVSPIAKFLGIKTSAVLDIGLSIDDEIYGSFSLRDLTYGDIRLKSVGGNLNLTQGKGSFPGTITLVSRDFSFKDRKIFEFGESALEIANHKLAVKGLFKSKNKKLNYNFAQHLDTVEVNYIRFEYPGGWLYLVAPFSFAYKHDLSLQGVRFLGNKGEDFQINNLSLSALGIKGDLDLIGFRPEFLSEFGLISHPFSGKVSSKISIAGTPDAPAFNFKGGGKIVMEEEKIGDSLTFDLRYEDNSIFIKNLSVIENGKYSNFDGMIDAEKKYLDVDMNLKEAGSWVFSPLMKYLTANMAKLSGDLKVKGPFKEPLIYGRIILQEADLFVKNPGIKIKELKAMASFQGAEGKLENISALLGEGKVQAEGIVNLRDNDFDIKMSLKNTPINWQYVNTIIDGDLILRKDRQDIRIEGNVELSRATITMEFEQKGEKGRRPSNLFLDLTFDANQGNVWIRNDLANIELAGKVGVSYQGGPLLLSGNLEVRQGMFYYLYKSFEVVEGKFNFNESTEINPNIDVKAITLISSRSNGNHEQDTVFLVVSGTMKTPEFDLYSKSSLSKAEIMTLLSLNLGWEDLTSVKPIGQSVTETAFNYWVRQTLNRRLKEEFGIDVLEMQGGSGHYEFVVGKYVTDKLFVKARTDLQSYGISEVQAEYKLKKWGYMSAEKDFEGTTRFLFNLEWRY
ncbi:translocation/assembly module TamB domain-containing protein [candidate division WOR-3 bacterium]|nr:translocation/assembly module TamB domain-containing protein [candidate division WOR-3 bacterium]